MRTVQEGKDATVNEPFVSLDRARSIVQILKSTNRFVELGNKQSQMPVKVAKIAKFNMLSQ